jgi:hypothetical protein
MMVIKMSCLINLSEIKQSTPQSAIAWLGKHKIEIAGALLTGTTVAAVIAVSIFTFGTTAIICGSVLGGGALFIGIGTTSIGITHHIKEKKIEETNFQKAKKIAEEHDIFSNRIITTTIIMFSFLALCRFVDYLGY